MEVISTRLVLHEIDNDYVQKNCSPKTLELAGDHKYGEDIQNCNIAISISDINNNDEYAYFFIGVRTAIEGNKEYTIKKVVFDERLKEETIAIFIYNVLYGLVNGNCLRIDRIIAIENHSFYEQIFQKTYQKVANEIINVFLLKRDGVEIESNQNFMGKLGKIREQMQG